MHLKISSAQSRLLHTFTNIFDECKYKGRKCGLDQTAPTGKV